MPGLETADAREKETALKKPTFLHEAFPLEAFANFWGGLKSQQSYIKISQGERDINWSLWMPKQPGLERSRFGREKKAEKWAWHSTSVFLLKYFLLSRHGAKKSSRNSWKTKFLVLSQWWEIKIQLQDSPRRRNPKMLPTSQTKPNKSHKSVLSRSSFCWLLECRSNPLRRYITSSRAP